MPYLGPPDGPKLLDVREAYWFDDLGEMTATSNLVVVASLDKIEPGRRFTYADGVDLVFQEATFTVTDVLYGTHNPSDLQVELDELYTGVGGAPLPRWLHEGSTSVMFLVQQEDRPDLYRPVNSQGVYRVDEPGTPLIATVSDSSFVDRLSRLSLEELRSRLAEILPKIASGEIRPQRTLPLRQD
jgi:hypothetical protein